jgi:hypothetical protein
MLFSLLSLREREIKFGGKRRAVGAGGLFTVVVAFLARHLLENSLSAVLSCCCARGFALKCCCCETHNAHALQTPKHGDFWTVLVELLVRLLVDFPTAARGF